MYESNGNIVALDNPKRLTVIQGINDCIVAESGNVLLICKKEDEQTHQTIRCRCTDEIWERV